jgi:hypothetical protein
VPTDILLEALTITSEPVPPLTALPIGAAITVIARSLVGVRTIGVFAPALLAIAAVQVGASVALVTIALAALTGLAVIPVVERLAISRVARIALLLSGICAAVEVAGLGAAEQAALPLVVLCVIVERSWECAMAEGGRPAARLLGGSFGVAAVIGFVLVLPPVRSAAGDAGLLLTGACCVVIVVAGAYRGLRWSERRRFWALAPVGGA